MSSKQVSKTLRDQYASNMSSQYPFTMSIKGSCTERDTEDGQEVFSMGGAAVKTLVLHSASETYSRVLPESFNQCFGKQDKERLPYIIDSDD